METVVVETRTKSDARFLKNFSKRIGANVIDSDELLEDIALGRLIEEGMKTPSVDRSVVMEFLQKR